MNRRCLALVKQVIRYRMQAASLLSYLTFWMAVLCWVSCHVATFALLTHQKTSVRDLTSQLTQGLIRIR